MPFDELVHVDLIFISAVTVTFGGGLAAETANLRPVIATRFWRLAFCGQIWGSEDVAARLHHLLLRDIGAKADCWRAAWDRPHAERWRHSPDRWRLTLRRSELIPSWLGLVDTPLIDELFGGRREALIASAAAQLPDKRVRHPLDIADGVLFLMKKGFVTGITLTIVGAWLAAGLVHASDANAHP